MKNKQAYDNYNLWVTNVKDKAIKTQLEAIRGDEASILNAFYKELEFGTGGLRGEIGAGTACLNIYTVGKATEGVARFMTKRGLKSVAISYDSRINSELFAKYSACVLAAHGIKSHIVSDISPTPFLSYAVRELKCGMGIMITASHNPAKYNGYKLFGSDSCQLNDDDSNCVKNDYIDKVDIFEVNPKKYGYYVSNGLIVNISDSLIESYL
ncbi:MAG: phospho-sugar mutase, partial [Firmicutes bacterium]|nr:phospho-sugar mutase [Bacillota bacterium]